MPLSFNCANAFNTTIRGIDNFWEVGGA